MMIVTNTWRPCDNRAKRPKHRDYSATNLPGGSRFGSRSRHRVTLFHDHVGENRNGSRAIEVREESQNLAPRHHQGSRPNERTHLAVGTVLLDRNEESRIRRGLIDARDMRDALGDDLHRLCNRFVPYSPVDHARRTFNYRRNPRGEEQRRRVQRSIAGRDLDPLFLGAGPLAEGKRDLD